MKVKVEGGCHLLSLVPRGCRCVTLHKHVITCKWCLRQRQLESSKYEGLDIKGICCEVFVFDMNTSIHMLSANIPLCMFRFH